MIDLEVRLKERSYPVRIGSWRDWDLRALARDWPAHPWALVVDRRAWEVWSRDVSACLGAAGIEPKVLELDAGESAKEHATLFRIYDHLLQHRIRRDGTLAVFGGGVLGDLAGFAAATWQRGIRLVQIPTTLLSQVDSSVGGKTGLNYGGLKNLIGSFHQPSAVLISPEWLSSLPPREFTAGLAEVIKCGVIRDTDLLRLLEEEDPARLPLSPRLNEVLGRALAVKARIVEADERDHSLRHLLNFGHTVGHALESITGFESLLHGEAVSLGMAAALRLSCLVASLPQEQQLRCEALLARYGLPLRVPAGIGEIDVDRLFALLTMDKKHRSGNLPWVLTSSLGTATVAPQVPEEMVRIALTHILNPI